jgi:hypothetical protein
MDEGHKNYPEGWLNKKKSKEGNFAFFAENKRYFRVKAVKGVGQAELALCYYRNVKDKEPRGWVYLKDVHEIADDRKSFSIISPARRIDLCARDEDDHMYWLQQMVNLCPHAVTVNVKSKLYIMTKLNYYSMYKIR